MGLPRLRLATCFHTEKLDDDHVFERTMAFSRDFRAITGTPAWLCVMTPECASIRTRLQESGFAPERYGERILALAEHAEIGYHGHFYLPGGPRMVADQFRWELAVPQAARELAWLRGLGCQPRIYTGGWWVLRPALLDYLAAEGFRLDCSTRGPRPGSHGDRYPGPLLPVGRRFKLVPGMLEIGSLPYFNYPWPMYRNELNRWLPSWGQEDLWAILPHHDYDMAAGSGHEWRIVEQLTRSPYVTWLDPESAVADADGIDTIDSALDFWI